MHNILLGLPWVLGVVFFLAALVGFVVGGVKLYTWADDNFPNVGGWVLAGSLWIIIILLFSWEIGATRHAY